MQRNPILSVIIWIVAMAANAAAQSGPKPAAQESTGFTYYLEFGGSANSEGQVYQVATSVGYDFNPHFGADVGVPFYFVRPSSTTGGTSTNGLGNPFLDLHVKFLNPTVNFASMLTGVAPAKMPK